MEKMMLCEEEIKGKKGNSFSKWWDTLQKGNTMFQQQFCKVQAIMQAREFWAMTYKIILIDFNLVSGDWLLKYEQTLQK